MSEAAIGDAERAVLLALADDEHLMGQRHTEWIGVAPFLEEDLAFSSIAQDELGHAAMVYELVLDAERESGAGAGDVDRLAFEREPSAYRSCWLVEAPCTDWAEALVRHWLYDAAEELRWGALGHSSHAGIAGIAARALHEERYHRRHADALLDALGTDRAAGERVDTALRRLLPLGAAVFESPAESAEGADRGVVGPPLEELAGAWQSRVAERFGAIEWSTIEPPLQSGRTARSEWFDEVYGRMREVLLLDPGAAW